MESRILANIGWCESCETILQSYHRHDYKSCKCGSFVDGGLDYIRCGGKIMTLTVTSNDEFQLIRRYFAWGRNYDKDKNLLPETEWIKLKDLDQGHLEALITYTEGKWVNELFIKELEFRNIPK